MSDDGAELIGVIVGFVAIAAAVIAAIVFIIVPIIVVSMGIGALCGGGYSIYNYAVAFGNNVKQEQTG